MTDTVDDFLEHFGVKGMKWGVRNDRGHEGERAKTKTIVKADKKYEKSFSGMSGYIKMHNAMAEGMNKRLDGLNAKFEGIDVSVPGTKGHTDYHKAYEKTIEEVANEVTSSFGTNASGTGRVKITKVGKGEDAWWEAGWEDIKHANEVNGHFKIVPKFNNKGFIISQTIEFIEKSIEQFDSVDSVLEHFGIKGMRWGRRKAEYDVADGETLVTQRKPGTKVSAVGGKNVPAHADAIKAASSRQKAKASTTDALSTQELQELVSRMNLEQQYSRLNAANVSPGRKFVKDLLNNKETKQQVNKILIDVVKKKAATI